MPADLSMLGPQTILPQQPPSCAHINYGDSAGLSNPELQNLNGKPYEAYDEAGLLRSGEYDFKGNLLKKSRYVIDDAVMKPSLNLYFNLQQVFFEKSKNMNLKITFKPTQMQVGDKTGNPFVTMKLK